MPMPVEVFGLPSTLPEDPILRKQCLEDLMTKFHSSLSFIQVECQPKIQEYSGLPQFAVIKSFKPSFHLSGLSYRWSGVAYKQPLRTEETTVWIFLFSVQVDTSF